MDRKTELALRILRTAGFQVAGNTNTGIMAHAPRQKNECAGVTYSIAEVRFHYGQKMWADGYFEDEMHDALTVGVVLQPKSGPSKVVRGTFTNHKPL